MKHVYTSIDLGSDSIKVVVCELFMNKLNLLAASSYPSKGIKNGLIVDAELAAESILKAKSEIEAMLGIKIQKVITSVPSYNASFTAIQGRIEIDEVVTGNDIGEVLQAAYRTKEIPDKEMVTILPIDFMLDDQEHIRDPKDMTGHILGVRAIMVSVPKKNIYSVVGILERLGLEVVDITVPSIANIYAFKTRESTNQMGAIVDIGSDTTSISIYNKGIPIKNSILGVGGKNIDGDIMYLYKLLPSDAVKMKERFALASAKYASPIDYFEVTDRTSEVRRINQREISELMESKLEEILILARKEIKLLTKQDVDYIIITGGTSGIANFEVVLENVCGTLPTLGSIRIPGVRNNKYSIALGNIVYFINKLKLKGIDYTMISEEDMTMLSPSHKGLLNISSESMLGKVFGYFWNE